MEYILSMITNILANISSLKSLYLVDCGLYGEFPVMIFQLPKLQIHDVSFNENLTVHLPEFHWSSQLQVLKLSHTGFYGELPASIGNIDSLNTLDIWECNFSRQFPSSLGNLSQLVCLDLSDNNFRGQSTSSLSWLCKLTKLTTLSLAKISFNGDIPHCFANLNQLTHLGLRSCQLAGQIPSWLMNLTNLIHLDLSYNELQGPIPNSVSQLKNLESLGLHFNNLNGIVELDMFLKLKKLNGLLLSSNKLTLLAKISTNTTLQKFYAFGFRSCNLSEFPSFVHQQDQLKWLDLSDNYIHGQIPKWVWNTSEDTLEYMNLSHNFLTGFEQHPVVFPWTRVRFLDLSSNMLQGSLPIPSPSTFIYLISGNKLTGEISPLICNLNSLYALDLAKNSLSVMLPACLSNFSPSLSILNLTTFTIPQTFTKGCSLRMITLSFNQLQGKIPRSLAYCTRLEFLILGNNHINDVFPSWLGALPELKVLILRHNQFHGAIRSHTTKFVFPKLRIIDLSYNEFRGKLPTKYFLSWNDMKMVDMHHLTYMHANTSFRMPNFIVSNNYLYSMTMTNKGKETEYAKILEFFIAIDLSSNNFEGEMPEVIGDLTGLHSLNLSNNILTGHIPTSLANLTEIEALDLSQNKFSGEIPQQLTQLTFLACFNVSHNHLMGPIPQGMTHFKTVHMKGTQDCVGNLCQTSVKILRPHHRHYLQPLRKIKIQ